MALARLGPYQILNELGRGAMGTVYAARGPDGSSVALKVLARSDGRPLARFQREQRLLAELAATGGFVPVLDSGEADGVAYLVMPLLGGGTLRDLLKRGPLDLEAALTLVTELAHALGRAHAQGIVHRDLKPENVLFDSAAHGGADPTDRVGDLGQAVVGDLGLAKHFDRELDEARRSRSLSKSGALLGTIGYAAPEQLQNAKAVGPTADVYALGVILYECLAGMGPFAADTTVAAITRQARARYTPLREVAPGISRALEAVVARALAPDPADRFEDGAALAAELEAIRSAPDDAPGGRAARVALVAAAGAFLLLVGGGVGWLARRAVVRPTGASPAPSPIGARSPRPSLTVSPSVSPSRSPSASARDQAASLLVVARSALRANDVRAAREALDKAIAFDPTLADAWGARAEVNAHEGQAADATRDAERALALDPRHAQALTARAVARFTRGDREGALADVTSAITLEPRNDAAWKTRAGFYVKTNDLDRALSDLARALELRPDAFTFTHRAMVQFKRGQLRPALEDLDRAIALEPGYENAWANRSSVKMNMGDVPGALADAERAVELDPKDDMAHTHHGLARLMRGEVVLAEADFRKALELSSVNEPALANLALILAGRGELEEARGLADRAVALASENPDALALRGRVRELADDRGGAIHDYERALALGLGGPKAELARKSLLTLRGR